MDRHLVSRVNMYDQGRIQRRAAPKYLGSVGSSARDALLRGLRPFFSDSEKVMMSEIRIGVLRTAIGVPELDEAVQVRTTKIK